jgi:hypothetical protein
MTTPPIDLCYACLVVVADNITPTFAFAADERPLINGNPGQPFNYLGPKSARGISNGEVVVYTKAREWRRLPMVAMTTVNGNRVCGEHIYTRRGVNRPGWDGTES